MLPGGCVRLDPGGHATRQVLVRNLGLTTERLTFEVVGPAASWTTLDPPVLILGPEAAAQIAVHFHPPRVAHVRAGPMPFGVLTTSARERTGRVVEQLVEMGRFTDVVAELVAASVRRARATYGLTVANRGNVTVRVNLRGRDSGGELRVRCMPTSLTVFPGAAGHSRIRVRSARRHWRGPPVARPFQIVVDYGGCIPLVVPEELILHPILPH